MKRLVTLVCIVLYPLSFCAVGRAESVNAILARMDAAAPTFHAMSSDVEMLTYTAILSDKTDEKGTLTMQKLKSGEVRAILDFQGASDAREIAFLGKIVRIYYPNLKTYQDYDVGKNTNVLNQFLLLGFGSSGKDLAANYDITAEGAEKVAGQDAAKLLLAPKNEQVKARLSKIEIWIPNNAAYPVQQQFYEPSGNYRIVTYTDVKLNPPVKGTLELKLPHDVKRQGP
ncbi:MAG: outer membrane lipoprotein-sorting protein [Acidobacteriaceae bacterium]|nr:outer membrane lipoprotein-sorting protein [Acidobacteriaceae bacterium]